MGYAKFAKLCAQSGVDAVLIVDMPPEEAGDFTALMREQGIDIIYLISPTTDENRIRTISAVASGYLYYVSLKGVTGANTLDVDSVAQKLQQIRAITDLPVGVGFGIKDGATAQAVARIADAVVVGSALVKQIDEFQNDQATMNSKLATTLQNMREMMDAG
jgi:tryptophan synthase alpha chain